MTTASRKLDHIRICLEEAVESPWRPFDDLMLLARAIPGIDYSEIDTRCRFLGRELKAPFMICGMTGGHPETKEINLNLALAAQVMGVALGVGSQRAALEDATLEETFSVVRDAAPDVPIVGNIGAVQLRREGPEVLDRLAEMIEADAVAVHLNYLQECAQPEGETDGRGIIDAVKEACAGKMPIIIKETGGGICREDAAALVDAGVEVIDVGGLGGTSWAAVETFRAKERGDSETYEIGRIFSRWGLPTPVSVVECASVGADVISSGGVRSGLDAAKSLALGAKMAGAALPFLRPATISADDVAKVLRNYIREIKTSMFLTASANISEMRASPIIINGRVKEILGQRGFDTNKFAIIERCRDEEYRD